MIALAVLGLICIAALSGLCFIGGYEYGVKETERRWSEVVTKAEWERQREQDLREAKGSEMGSGFENQQPQVTESGVTPTNTLS